MFVLDTDIAIWILRGEPKVINALDRLVGSHKTGISTITVAEIYKYTFPSELEKNTELIDQQKIFSVNLEIAKEGGLYWNQFHKQLEKLSLTDTLIAATAKIHNCALLTLNTRHFPMSDIKVINPLT